MNHNGPNPVIYPPIARDEIRLLKLISSKELHFEFVVRPIGGGPDYATLSYCWGPDKPQCSIVIDNCVFAVRQNLYNALDQFRQGINAHVGPKKPLSYLFWIDALCINQQDKAELESQVLRMTSIYSSAARIYVWLGLPVDISANELAAAKLREIQHRYHKQYKYRHALMSVYSSKERQKFEYTMASWVSQAIQDTTIFDHAGTPTHDAWQGIFNMWKSEWFTRTWAHQEATVPERRSALVYPVLGLVESTGKVVFACGHETTTWVEFNTSIMVADYVSRHADLAPAIPSGIHYHIRRVSGIRLQRSTGNTIEIADILHRFRTSDCQKPHDKVYVPFLVASALGGKLGVDYDLTPLQLYTTVAEVLSRTEGRELDFLGYSIKADKPSRRPSEGIDFERWPSWVPNWDDPVDMYPVPKELAALPDLGVHWHHDVVRDPAAIISRKPLYNASQDSVPKFSINIRAQTMTVSGFIFDTIKGAVAYNAPTDKVRDWTSATLATLRNANPIYSPTDETYDTVIRHINVGDAQYFPNGTLVVSRNSSVDYAFLRNKLTQLTPADVQRQATMRVAEFRATTHRGLGVTEGGYLGLVPNTTLPGDRVCVFFGGQVLYILRPIQNDAPATETKYAFVGEAYMHGLMDGQAMLPYSQEARKAEQFVLV